MNEFLLLVGVVAVSFSGPFNALAVQSGLDGYVLAALRLTSASLVLLSLPGVFRNLRLLRPHVRSLLAGGVFLGGHFALWTGAFNFTSLSSAMIFLCAQPLLSIFLAKDRSERITPALVGGLVLGTLGMLMLGAGDLREQGIRDVMGDLMVVLAGAAIVRYQYHTRAVSRIIPIWAFNCAVWGVAGLTVFLTLGLLVPSGWAKMSVPSQEAVLAIAGLVGVCTYLGHGCFNYVMPRIKILLLNLAILLEPVIGIAIGRAMGLEKQWPSGWRLAGALLILLGVSWALMSEGLAKLRERPKGLE
ncbi:MAG: DMT family transporter [Planctomycetota bacterium]